MIEQLLEGRAVEACAGHLVNEGALALFLAERIFL